MRWMPRSAVWYAILALVGASLACNLPPGVPITPTLIPTLPNPTSIALAATPTPIPVLSATPTVTSSPTATFTPTDTATPTPSLTPTLTFTPSDTATETSVPTETFTPTATASLTPTATGIPTDTPSVTPSLTLTPSYTLPPPSNTPTSIPPTLTPTQSSTVTPTFTPSATITPTQLPTLTPTELPSDTPVPPTDTAAPTLTVLPSITDTPIIPTDTPAPSLTAVPQPSISFVLPTIDNSTPTPIPLLPTQRPATLPGVVVISTSVGSGGGNGNGGSGNGNGSKPGGGAIGGVFGTVTAIAGTLSPTPAFLFYSGGTGGGSIYRTGDGLVTTLQPGQSYAVNPQTGDTASTNSDGVLFLNSQLFTLSPSSIYGPGIPAPKFRISQLKWSPDGRFLAFLVETPNARSGTLNFLDTIDDGLWIYDRGAKSTRQVFRNQYRPGQTIEIVYDYGWANDSRTLIVSLGSDTILVDSFANINK